MTMTVKTSPLYLYLLALAVTALPWRSLEAQQTDRFTFHGRPGWSVPFDPPRVVGVVEGLRGLPVSVQAEPRRYGRATVGLGAGVTLGAVALTVMLTSGNGNACTGSGDYLQLCRAGFIGGTALSGGIGALIGGLIRSDSPSGPVRPVLLGSALGAVVPFVLSIPVCSQEDPSNPHALCGYHGMTNPGITIAGAVAGGLLGYVIGGGFGSLQVVPIRTPRPMDRAGMELSVAMVWP